MEKQSFYLPALLFVILALLPLKTMSRLKRNQPWRLGRKIRRFFRPLFPLAGMAMTDQVAIGHSLATDLTGYHKLNYTEIRKEITITRLLAAITVFLLSLTFVPKVSSANSLTISFNNTAFAGSPGSYTAQEFRLVTDDILITGLDIQTSVVPAQTSIDTGLQVLVRGAQGLRIAYGATLSLNGKRLLTSGTATFNVDLSNTPIFIPKNSYVNIPVTFYNVAEGLTLSRTANIRYQLYSSGDRRYITLVMPYMDQPTNNGVIPHIPYFKSSSVFPLKVRAVNAFLSIYGSNINPGVSKADACLEWQHAGATVQSACFPTQILAADGNWQTPPMLTLNWDLPPGDTLTATTASTGLADIQLNPIVEVPYNFINTPELMFASFDTVDANVLSSYCNQYYSQFGGSTALPTCLALYPKATCLADNSCLLAQTSLPGDLNHDSKVDILDLNQFLASPTNNFDYNLIVVNYGKVSSLSGDLNSDGQVNINDLNLLLANFTTNFDYNLIVANYGKGATVTTLSTTATDLNNIITNWGNTTCGNAADLNRDCKVDNFDYNVLIAYYGR